MADYERTILEHYGLTNAFPAEWPAEKDNSDASDEEDNGGKAARNGTIRRSKSRYSALERAASDRKSFLPGAQRGENGVENMVSRDEPDPLGSSDSVVRILRARNLPVQDDPRIRNRFLLSSTTFSPTLFLSQVHQDASTQDLLSGLEKLSESIDQKSASLKQLVETNFERFVRAKATIDNVYTEMKYRGAEPPPPPRAIRTHSRHASRTSFRASSGNQASMADPAQDGRKKNALTKESEYGVMGIKKPLLELSAKAEEVWGPALGGRDKEESMKVMTEMAERYKEMHEVGTIMTEKIKQKDYEGIAEEYRRAASFADDARKIVERLDMKPNDAEITQILLAGRVWNDVERQIRSFKEDIWQKLGSTQNIAIRSDALSPQDQHMELINILLELGVEKNPVWIWLETRYDYLKNKIQITSDRSRMAIEVSRRRLASGGEPTALVIASHLRSLGRQSVEDKPTSMDSSDVIELWEQSLAFTREMLSAQGILGEVTDFWQSVQSFLKGDLQKKLSIGIKGQSKKHHELSEQEVTQLRDAAVELVDMLRESISDFFTKLPPEDISPLFSPLPPNTPMTPMARSYGAQLSPGFRDRQYDDPKNMPPPSPKTGQSWEKLAFWPPWSNSLSGVHYLARLLSLLGTGASEMASISPVNGDSKAMKLLQDLTTEAREKCVIAICAAWNKDAENIKVLEDWRRSPEKRDLTRMPAYFEAFESAILTGMQKIVYISEAKLNAYEVVAPPPSKLLQMVRSQFVTTLYKSLSGMVENAEKSLKKLDDDWAMDTDGLASPVAMVVATSIGAGTVNAGDKNVRMLLTLSNLNALRADVVPNLTTQFENAFSVKLTEESKTIRDVLSQIDARLFQSFTRPSVDTLRSIIRAGIASPSWSPSSKPDEVRPYVYEALLSIVLVHTQVSTTASSLTPQVLTYLLEQCSRELLEAFKLRQRYTINELMQATLDVEFVCQTLSQYTSSRASSMQSEIYQELDKGTDNEARQQLQKELPAMRAVLKNLREGSRSEFACFKKVRNRQDRSQTQSIISNASTSVSAGTNQS